MNLAQVGIKNIGKICYCTIIFNLYIFIGTGINDIQPKHDIVQTALDSISFIGDEEISQSSRYIYNNGN